MRGDNYVPEGSYAAASGIANHMGFAKMNSKSFCRVDTGIDTRNWAEQDSKLASATWYQGQ